MPKRLISYIILISLLAGILASCAPTATSPNEVTNDSASNAAAATTEAQSNTDVRTATPDRLILATTTSTQDSGLLDYLLPMFEDEFKTHVDVIAVGTDQALQIGKDGNADVLLIHARSHEDAFMAAGDGSRREDVMYNDFVIVGPESDPANIKNCTTAADAFRKIAEAKATFISRGDKSGTNTKELAIWKAAGITPEGEWYVSAGQGMGEVLTMANELQAYTLSDRATYLVRTITGTDLKILLEGQQDLLNPYGVIAVNPNKGSQINSDLANKFIDWITSVPVQKKIGEFGVEDFGLSLFHPSSALYLASQKNAAENPALRITGLVTNEQGWSEGQIKAMDTIEVKSTNNKGEAVTYTGILISTLINLAAPTANARSIVFIANDGYTVETSLTDVMACADCIVSFHDPGGFSIVMPGKGSSLQVDGVIEIQIK